MVNNPKFINLLKYKSFFILQFFKVSFKKYFTPGSVKVGLNEYPYKY